MPTSKEYRQRADECVELMCEANEWYVNTALLELAEVFRIRAEKLERYEGTTMQYVVLSGEEPTSSTRASRPLHGGSFLWST
jgi:hypothetical protein